MARSFHETVLSGKLWQAVRRATDREGGGCLLPDDQCTKTGQLVVEVLREKNPDMRVPPVENPTCVAFEEYGEVPKTVPLDSPGVGDEGWGREASGVAENPQGSCQGVGGRVDLPQGTDTPRVTELPWGDETPGVNTEPEGATRAHHGRTDGSKERTPPPHTT